MVGDEDRPILVHVTTVPQALSFFTGQVRYMQARGIEVHAVSSPGERLTSFGEQEHIQTHEVNMKRRISPLHDCGAAFRLTRVLGNVRPAIVHAHTPKGGLLGMIGAWLTRTPVRIYSIHGLRYMTASGWRRLLLQWTERVSCKLSHRVICVSHSLRDVVIDDSICPSHKLRVLRGGSTNGVDATVQFNPASFTRDGRSALRAELGIDPSDLVVGFVGRLVRDKGVEDLATAWKNIRDARIGVNLLLVGPVEPQDPIDPDVLRAFRDDPRVIMTGSVIDTTKMYAIADLVVLPTYREGLPNVPLEAAAMELPVVATNIPGCVDAVRDGVSGTLVPPRDAKSLQASIERYLDDPELRKQHGKAGREHVLRHFRREDIWEAVYQEYVRLLEEKGVVLPLSATVSDTC